MAERKPGRAICLDQEFTSNNQLKVKANTVQIMADYEDQRGR